MTSSWTRAEASGALLVVAGDVSGKGLRHAGAGDDRQHGHPSPYCDGERFTFVSDGVVEAGNQQRELFGFERTREMSVKSAHEIAEAAKAWGQNDDITVVTVRRKA